MSIPDGQKLVVTNGKHTACDAQHELITQMEVFDVQLFVILLHGSKIEHRTAGAQYLLLLNVAYSKQNVDDIRQLLLSVALHCPKEQLDDPFHAELDEVSNEKSTVVPFLRQELLGDCTAWPKNYPCSKK